MLQFTVEETNLLSIFHTESRAALIEAVTAVMPDMDGDMRELAVGCIAKLAALSEEEYAALSFVPADEA